MTKIERWIRTKRYRWAVFLHSCRVPIKWGDPTLGAGDVRRANLDMMMDRWDAKEPKPEAYGLPAGTARSKEMERTNGQSHHRGRGR